jgi:hypothetical protein
MACVSPQFPFGVLSTLSTMIVGTVTFRASSFSPNFDRQPSEQLAVAHAVPVLRHHLRHHRIRRRGRRRRLERCHFKRLLRQRHLA